MELKVKRFTQSAKIPNQAHYGDLGYDVFADEDVIFQRNEFKLVSIGIGVQAYPNSGFFVKDRSSMASVGLVTHAGVIDAGYQGEVKILFHNIADKMMHIIKGDKIAQLVPVKTTSFEILEVSNFHSTKRGQDGFGSTGK